MDSAFQAAPYPGYTISELQEAIATGHPNAEVMRAEVERRYKVQQGDKSVMTPGERLRWARLEKVVL